MEKFLSLVLTLALCLFAAQVRACGYVSAVAVAYFQPVAVAYQPVLAVAACPPAVVVQPAYDAPAAVTLTPPVVQQLQTYTTLEQAIPYIAQTYGCSSAVAFNTLQVNGYVSGRRFIGYGGGFAAVGGGGRFFGMGGFRSSVFAATGGGAAVIQQRRGLFGSDTIVAAGGGTAVVDSRRGLFGRQRETVVVGPNGAAVIRSRGIR